tara:strand:- start:199 stop:408 length:210 start_codon:yes stop_codon:yes gene_type:complete
MKSIVREELKKEFESIWKDSDEEKKLFYESIDKLPMELVRQLLSRILEMKTQYRTFYYDILSIISQNQE